MINLIKPIFKASTLIIALTMPLASISLQAAQYKVGDKAPDFNVTTLAGQSVKLSDYKNVKPLYLKFWATWCSYCIAEFPHLQEVYNKYGNDIEVLAINVGMNDSINNIERLYQKNAYNIPTFFDKKGELTSRYGVVGTPYTILIDRQGKIAYTTFLSTDELDRRIEDWSNEAQVMATKSNGE